MPRSPPPGFRLIRALAGDEWSRNSHRGLVLLLTFIAYTCYHASRKPTSIVKSVLHPPAADAGWPSFNGTDGTAADAGWAPFNGTDGTAMLGEIDVAFLACYSLGMYAAGHLGDRLDLRMFLSFGMIGSGAFVALFGMGYFLNIHYFSFFLWSQMAAGLLQATGWPSVVAVVGNWFGQRKRGLIMGIWNAHTSVGNISGSLLAASVLQYGWGWSFVLSGGLIAFGGFLIFLFLAAYPEDLGFQNTEGEEEESGGGGDDDGGGGRAIGIWRAFSIPGVIPFALCLFFAKLVAYTFLYWLPYYLSHTEIGGEYLSVKSAGSLSTLFDVGGIFGGILAGLISDKSNCPACTAATFIFLAIPALICYRVFGRISKLSNIALMMVTGLVVNGPYSLITTAVSADLGTHSSLQKNSRALATVTAIIDGTGSVGAAIGPLVTGFVSKRGWTKVFLMLVSCSFAAGVLLFSAAIAELRELFGRRQNISSNDSTQRDVEASIHAPLLPEGTAHESLPSDGRTQRSTRDATQELPQAGGTTNEAPSSHDPSQSSDEITENS